MRYVGAVKPSFVKQGIKWIYLEEDPKHTGGVYLYLHREKGDRKKCIFDEWYEKVEQARKSARKWGIEDCDWEELGEEDGNS